MKEYPGWNIEAVNMTEDESQIMLKLMQLDKKYRIPIALHEIEGYSIKEIAKITGISEANVKKHLYRGKAALRNKLKGAV